MADAQGLPDYVLDPNAVLGDTDAAWRYGRPPSYKKTREYYEQSTSPPPFHKETIGPNTHPSQTNDPRSHIPPLPR